MAPSTAPAQPASPIRARLSAAAQRAMAEGLSARMNQDGTWACKSYTITPFGTAAVDVRCNCAGGSTHGICKHVAPVIFGRKYGLVAVTAKRIERLPTPDDVALSRSIIAEIRHEMIVGVAPSLQDMCA